MVQPNDEQIIEECIDSICTHITAECALNIHETRHRKPSGEGFTWYAVSISPTEEEHEMSVDLTDIDTHFDKLLVVKYFSTLQGVKQPVPVIRIAGRLKELVVSIDIALRALQENELRDLTEPK